MSIDILKEKLENNACHIHKQQPLTAIAENGDLNIKTCCILFEKQLQLLAGDQNENGLFIRSV